MALSRFISDWQHKNILVFGVGILGGGKQVITTLQQFDCQIGLVDRKSEVELNDTLSTLSPKQISFRHFDGHEETSDIDWADLIIKNPAIPMEHPLIQYALKIGKRVTTEASLFLKYTRLKTIGVTGTRGKTTTTLMIAHVLRQQLGDQVMLGGNIQDTGTLSLLLAEQGKTHAVLELSSFALEGCHSEQVSPNYAAITNLFPDHMDRYLDMQSYAHAKKSILAYQTANDFAFLNQDNEWTPFFQDDIKSQVTLIQPTTTLTLHPNLHGTHNQLNAYFALTVCTKLGIDRVTAQQSIRSFAGAPYRQQAIGQTKQTLFINDATSTTPEALIAALTTFPTAAFIIGGTTKHLSLLALPKIIKPRLDHCIFLKGSGTQQLFELLGQEYPTHTTLESAFAKALKLNPSVLVFPRITSFELFKNEFDRAKQFSDLVADHIALV